MARPGTSWDNPLERPRDLSGRSIKTSRVRAVHTTDPALPGGTAYLLEVDPWLGYQRGRELTLREFAVADGVFGESGRQAGPRLEDGATKMATRDHASSCAMCHNTPWRDMGSGATFAKNGGRGRNTPHLFGAGLMEMLGWQNRLKLLEEADANRDGWISQEEAKGREAYLEPFPAGSSGRHERLALGRFDDADGDGRPDLDPIVAVFYVDAQGKRIPWARTLRDKGVAGYNLEFQVFGYGHHRRQTEHGAPIPSTLRAFTAAAFDLHSGLQSFDPTILEDPDGDGLSGVSLAGAQQFATAAGRDRGAVRDGRGHSADDPDRDGKIEEISEGDLDLAEWFQLNHPRPAERLVSAAAARGRETFSRVGCAGCHTPDWQILAGNPNSKDYAKRYAGDRRFFDLEVKPDAAGELTGRVVTLAENRTDARRPRCGAFTVRGLYSDLRTHDLGEGFAEMQFDGSVIRRHRTTPLWGVGSTAPYGHDGASLDLDAAIRRHGGEAQTVTQSYAALPAEGREELVAFLSGLVLYSTEDLPCDVNGDGRVEPHFAVAGRDTGRERFNPEWLFRVPGRIEGPVTAPDGSKVVSFALTNVDEAYGTKLGLLRDEDGDGFPDDLAPAAGRGRLPALRSKAGGKAQPAGPTTGPNAPVRDPGPRSGD
ncbi:MAG: hypothetical protein HY303_02215 [Candidatus Wallbacteria bacterium]|nr:hypothetical protein [Candidatus Wallbacteria bacterium]